MKTLSMTRGQEAGKSLAAPSLYVGTERSGLTEGQAASHGAAGEQRKGPRWRGCVCDTLKS